MIAASEGFEPWQQRRNAESQNITGCDRLWMSRRKLENAMVTLTKKKNNG